MRGPSTGGPDPSVRCGSDWRARKEHCTVFLDRRGSRRRAPISRCRQFAVRCPDAAGRSATPGGMPPVSNLKRNVTIAASCASSAVLGTIHAFSVFIPEWEGLEGADRAGVSLIYSTALVSLTIAVLFGYRVYERLAPSVMFATVGVVAAIGLMLSARGVSLVSLYVAYGLVFGGANGLGYGYALQLSGQAAPSHRGLAMGLVTAFYAVGATAAPLLFEVLIGAGGNARALEFMAAVVLVVALLTAAAVRWSSARYESETTSAKQSFPLALKRARALLWVGYGCAVTAGLMVIGHAYGIAIWMNLDARAATWAATVVAFGNMLGGFSAGYCADRISGRTLLRWLPVFTSAGLLLLAGSLDSARFAVFVGLGLVGYCYGAIIAVYPVVVADVFGARAAPRIYGQVFTAWGLAGLLGPWSSGWLFDQTDSYTTALLLAVLLSGISIVAIRRCPAAPAGDVPAMLATSDSGVT